MKKIFLLCLSTYSLNACPPPCVDAVALATATKTIIANYYTHDSLLTVEYLSLLNEQKEVSFLQYEINEEIKKSITLKKLNIVSEAKQNKIIEAQNKIIYKKGITK